MYGNIDRWTKDKYYYETIWKFNLSKINMAVPYFSMNTTGLKINSQPKWSSLSQSCPNVDPFKAGRSPEKTKKDNDGAKQPPL